MARPFRNILLRAAAAAFSLLTLFPLAQAQNGVQITPTSLIFGTETVGLQSVSLLVTATNTGNSTVTVSIASVTPSEFQLTVGTQVSLVPGGSTNYGILFAPDSAQDFTGALVLNVGGTNTTVTLTGTGVTTTAAANVSPAMVNFGNQAIGSTSATQIVNVTNTGASPMEVTTLTVVPPVFTATAATNTTINPGQSLPITLTFSPDATGPFYGTLDITYDVLPDGGVTLSGTGTPPSALAISSLAALPTGTQGRAYSATLEATSGSPPYTWSVVNGSALPSGLTLSSSGVLSGTISSSVQTGTYTFSIQVTDSASGTASLPFSLQVDNATPANCNDISFDIVGTSSLEVPITDLGTGTYFGQEGGLYPNGSNVPPASHQNDGIGFGQGIQPLDSNGNPDPNGKYAMISLGPSSTLYEFKQFIQMADADPAKNSHLVIIQGAQGGETLTPLTASNSAFWPTIFNYFLPQEGVTPQQVVVAWIEELDAGMSGTFPGDITTVQAQLETLAQLLIQQFPNLKLAYFSSRIYGGYSNGINTTNPEPYSYDDGYAVKLAIQDQINGDPNLNYNPANGPVLAPWMGWAAYYWANGMVPRSDGLVWTCQDLLKDGLHPSPAGSLKVAGYLLDFFKSDPTATPWFLNPPAPVVQLSPTALTFPAEVIGQSSSPETVTVTNTGNGNLNVSSIVSSDSEFTETDTCTNVAVPPNGTCTISVTFTPNAAGTRSGTLTINDNAAGGFQTLNLTGTGTSTPVPIVSFSPTQLTFSNQAVGSSSVPQNVTLTNIGTAALTLSTIKMGGSNPTDFHLSNTCTKTIGIDASCTISVTFTPTASGSRIALVQVTDNAAGSPQSVSVSGTGTAGTANLNPTSLNFGNVVVGTSSKSKTTTLTNTGSATVTGISINVLGAYSQTNTCGTSLPAGGNCTITVTFTPTTTGSETGTLTVTDTATNSPQTAALTGSGVVAVSITPPFQNFPKTALGITSPVQNFTVTNNQIVALTGINMTINGDFAQTNNCGTTLQPHASCIVGTTFTPTATGTRSGALTINDSASGSPQSASLKGKGEPQVGLSSTSVSFPAQTVGTTSSPKPVVLTNWLPTTLTISSMTITGDFAQTNNCGTSVPGNDTTCTINITFSPTAVGKRTGVLTITDNATNSPQTVTLSGTGQ
jgi:Putative Ig domain/Transmembrane protein 131-like N-terminal/Abnormal spindle-like microcephaly-assoc'd, ASPM-SPD-2-Hydin